MPIEQRNAYGFPIINSKLERAKEIAEAARKRIAQTCNCAECIRNEIAPEVEKLINNWRRHGHG